MASRTFRYYLDLIIVLTQKEIKVRYKSSILGYLWSVAHPLTLAFVFFVAFKVIMKIQMEEYALFLICGLFPWQWFSNSVGFSTTVFLGNASLIKKVKFPRSFIPLSIVLNDIFHYICSLPVIILFMFIYGKRPFLFWLCGIPMLVFIQFLLTYGICLMVSSINLFFRDLERLISILIMLLFYFTPIFYPEDMIPEEFKYLIKVNPLAPLIISWRRLFLHGTSEPSLILISLIYALAAFFFGYALYRRFSWKFAEVV